MKTTTRNNRNNIRGAAAFDGITIALAIGVVAILGVNFFTSRALEKKAEARQADLKELLMTPATPQVSKRQAEADVLQERVNVKLQELQALNEARHPVADQAAREERIYRELAELKRLQAGQFAPSEKVEKK